jgi:Xaa-Pro aminopeptidase
MVALLPDRLVLVTDNRYRDRAAEELVAAGVDGEIVIGVTQAEQQAALVAAFDGVATVGAEAASVSHARWEQLAALLPLAAADGHVADLRRTKDAGEIARMQFACRCADAALAEVAPTLGDGSTEADVRDELEYRMRRHGADGPSYATIVASGPDHAARPHHETGHRRIVEGDTVVIDVGALVDGYHSDMTRSFVIGDPTPEQHERYELLLAVQLAGLAAVSAGTPARDVDSACRVPVVEAGYGDWYLHGTGHGVGLLIHEDPFESPVATLTLRAGDVVTVEPGLYRVGFGGYRIEDLVEVTDTGCRILTAFPKDTPCLPSPPTT